MEHSDRRSNPQRGLVLAGLLLAVALSAMDSAIVATAVPTVVKSLGGFTSFPWVFSAYLLAIAVTIPLYGRLADHFGRKVLLLTGIAVFVGGSVLAGSAWNMPSLIVFRAVQGIGAGALRPIPTTVVGDMYTVEERGRVQGLIASVWGISAVAGPVIGGLFTQFISWRWIFFVNVPVGLAAMAMVWIFFREHIERRRVRADIAGAVLLVIGVGGVVLTLLRSGSEWAWGSAPMVLTGAGSIGVLVLFAVREGRTPNPIFPLWILGSRQLAGATLATLVVGLLTLGVSAYVPTFAQSVFGASPLVAGLVLGVMSVAWPIAAAYSANLYLKIGYRNTALVGTVFVIAGTVTLSMVAASSPIYLLAAGTVLLGTGLGLTTSPMIVGAQSVVDWGRRGVVTGAVTFGQMLGSALSTAIFGSVYNGTMAARFADAPKLLQGTLPSADQAARIVSGSGFSVPVTQFVRSALFAAGHHVFLGLIVVAAIGIANLLFITPRTFEYLPEDHGVKTGSDSS